MDQEKAEIARADGLAGQGIPHPTSTPKTRSKTVAHKAVFILVGLALWGFFSVIAQRSAQRSNVVLDLSDTSNSNDYMSAIASKGMLGSSDLSGNDKGFKKHEHKDKHHKHDKHKGDKHKHGKHHRHGHGGKHGHGLPPITPKAAEDLFLSVPNNVSARAASRRYTANAHPAGSGFDLITALNVKNEWEKELGLPASGSEDFLYDAGDVDSQARIRSGMGKLGVWIDTYYPVMNTPVENSVTLLTDPPFHAKLREDIVEGDPDSVQRDEVRVFHGLSVSGDVTGKYVYAGYGRKRDFEALQAKGVDFNDKIALVKYGGVFRGLKVKAAQEAGAIGCIIFTDPGDDGEVTEANGYEQYPVGPARQPSSVQRGSVQFLSKYPGDPTTPGEPAYKNASRVAGGNFPSIPSLPMSYEDVIPLLKALEGKGFKAGDVTPDWVGGLGFYGVDYWTGPSEVDLHFINDVNTRVMPIWNTMATIPGHITDEVVFVGNHRDAWVLGGADPNSGTASQYELVRGLGKLLKSGWKPLRTIVLASWDAEEYGLIGSTEWAEDFGDWLATNSAAYLNLDSSVSGQNFGAQASPSLSWLFKTAAEEINSSADPSRSVWEMQDDGDWKAWNAQLLGDDVEADFEELAASETGIKALGSGSDFTAFLQRYGVASGNLGFGGGPKSAVYHYHSIYDSFTWQEKFADPGFHKHVDAAKILGLITLRLADSIVLPINTTQYSLELTSYLKKVAAIADNLNVTSELNLTSLSKSISTLISSSQHLDIQKSKALKKLHDLLPPPHNHDHHSKLSRFFHEMMYKLRGHHSCSSKREVGFPFPPIKKAKEIKAVLEEIRGINKKLQGFESGFISEEGLKDREWYKHKGVAPGIWLGYGATTFPGLTEALTIDHSTELAQKEADELSELIDAMARRLSA